MDMPIHISFRHMERSPALEAEIHRRWSTLQRRTARLAGCRVTVEAPDGHHRHGGHFAVRLELDTERGKTIVCGGREETRGDEDAYIAVRESFEAATRLLVDATHGHGRPRGHGHEAA